MAATPNDDPTCGTVGRLFSACSPHHTSEWTALAPDQSYLVLPQTDATLLSPLAARLRHPRDLLYQSFPNHPTLWTRLFTLSRKPNCKSVAAINRTPLDPFGWSS
jgi:hypothetical protein